MLKAYCVLSPDVRVELDTLEHNKMRYFTANILEIASNVCWNRLDFYVTHGFLTQPSFLLPALFSSVLARIDAWTVGPNVDFSNVLRSLDWATQGNPKLIVQYFQAQEPNDQVVWKIWLWFIVYYQEHISISSLVMQAALEISQFGFQHDRLTFIRHALINCGLIHVMTAQEIHLLERRFWDHQACALSLIEWRATYRPELMRTIDLSEAVACCLLVQYYDCGYFFEGTCLCTPQEVGWFFIERTKTGYIYTKRRQELEDCLASYISHVDLIPLIVEYALQYFVVSRP